MYLHWYTKRFGFRGINHPPTTRNGTLVNTPVDSAVYSIPGSFVLIRILYNACKIKTGQVRFIEVKNLLELNSINTVLLIVTLFNSTTTCILQHRYISHGRFGLEEEVVDCMGCITV